MHILFSSSYEREESLLPRLHESTTQYFDPDWETETVTTATTCTLVTTDDAMEDVDWESETNSSESDSESHHNEW